MGAMKTDRVIVIGWDGGSFNVLDRMIERGLMPNLQGLISRGVRSPFLSTVPPLTAPAWVSLRTGKTPGNHGLFSFFKPPEQTCGSDHLERHTAESVKAATFWNILNQHGRKVCVVDMPLTDPVEEIDGVMVSGMMTRGRAGVLTHPEHLKEELLGMLGDSFSGTLTDGVDTSVSYLKHLTESLEWKSKQDFYLMSHCEWDCFVTVFSAVDALQHYFWRFMDPGCDSYTEDAAITAQIERFYKKLDEVLGSYMDRLGPADTVFVVSDHGFGPSNYTVYVNNWLNASGYLTLDHDRWALRDRLLEPVRLKKAVKKLDIFRLRSRISKGARQRIKGVLEKDALRVRWQDTKAYLRTNSEEGIYINRTDLFNNGSVEPASYEACVEEVIAGLAALRNPANGDLVFEFVRRRGLVHNGVCQDSAPDIVLRPAEGYVVRGYRRGAKPVIRYDDPFLSGTHSSEGIFIAAGPLLNAGRQAASIRIEDLAPMLLYTLETPVPEDMDGSICEDLFRAGVLQDRPPVYGRGQGNRQRSFGTGVQTTEEEAIRKQLSQLGYVD